MAQADRNLSAETVLKHEDFELTNICERFFNCGPN